MILFFMLSWPPSVSDMGIQCYLSLLMNLSQTAYIRTWDCSLFEGKILTCSQMNFILSCNSMMEFDIMKYFSYQLMVFILICLGGEQGILRCMTSGTLQEETSKPPPQTCDDNWSSEPIAKLSKKHRMNTDVRKSIFTILVTAEVCSNF